MDRQLRILGRGGGDGGGGLIQLSGLARIIQ